MFYKTLVKIIIAIVATPVIAIEVIIKLCSLTILCSLWLTLAFIAPLAKRISFPRWWSDWADYTFCVKLCISAKVIKAYRSALLS